MKITCKILAYPDKVGEDCFEALKRVFPEGIEPYRFQLQLPPDNPVIPKVIDTLQSYGFKMRQRERIPARNEFIDIEYIREFEEADLSAARYLLAIAADDVAYHEDRMPTGGLKIETSNYLNKRFRIAAVRAEIVVNNPTGRFLGKQGFAGLELRRCTVVGEGAQKYEDFPIWEVTSKLVMPPVSPECKFCDCEGGDDFKNPDKGCTIDEGLYVPTLLRYRASDLRKIEPFDVAHTREAMGYRLTHHPLIVSQRFYQCCKKEKLRLWWYPVVIDPD